MGESYSTPPAGGSRERTDTEKPAETVAGSMPTPLSLVGPAVTAALLLGLVALNTLIAAVAVRFFRLQLATQWGPVVYTALLVPVVYVVTALIVFGALGVGSGLGLDRGTLLVFFWGVPLSLGVSLDIFWIPPPEEIDVPAE